MTASKCIEIVPAILLEEEKELDLDYFALPTLESVCFLLIAVGISGEYLCLFLIKGRLGSSVGEGKRVSL